MVSGSRDKTVRVWDVATGKEVQKLEGHSEDVWSVSFSPVRVCRARARQLRAWWARSVWHVCACVGVLVCWGQVEGCWCCSPEAGGGVCMRGVYGSVCIRVLLVRVGVVVGVGSSGGDTARVRV